MTDLFLKYTTFKNNIIKLINNQQLLHNLIYSINFLELKILKTYNEINSANNLIISCRSLAYILIFCEKKTNINFLLYINYYDSNNLTIKNKFPFFLIQKYFKELGKIKDLIYIN